jgi:phosphoglycolate phosphatase-like HAD superfamily hydrolase
MKLILFDIDGTILESGGAGVRALDYAFRDVLSADNIFAGVCMAGKTDLQIVREGLGRVGLRQDNGYIPKILESYIGHLGREILKSDKRLKPGVREALEAVNREGDRYRLGLLTGNFEQGARIKLGSFGLNDYFVSGAFGSDHEDRNMLLPIAVERFNELADGPFLHSDCIVIGDTPLDVACAKPYGAASIAVATGPYAEQTLADAGADVVMRDLSDTESFMHILSGLPRQGQTARPS